MLTQLRPRENSLSAVGTFAFVPTDRQRLRWRTGSLGGRGLFLDLLPKLQRVGDPGEPLVRAPGTRDDDRPVAPHPSVQPLLDPDALDFAEERLQRTAPQPPDFDEHALIRDDELRVPDLDVRGEPSHGGHKKESEPGGPRNADPE